MRCFCCPTEITDAFMVQDPVSGKDVGVCYDCYTYDTFNCYHCGDPTIYLDVRIEVDGQAVCSEDCRQLCFQKVGV